VNRFLLFLAALIVAMPALAQQPGGQQRGGQGAKPQSETAQPAPSALPYDGDLDRLAEVMGALAFLRDLCGHKDGAAWRGRMSDLIEAEGTTPERRDRLAGAFNRGFRGLQPSYRRCTPAATMLSERLIREGAALSRAITSRYGM
jgi:uncharacterized protein (TIGR02301 family)